MKISESDGQSLGKDGGCVGKESTHLIRRKPPEELLLVWEQERVNGLCAEMTELVLSNGGRLYSLKQDLNQSLQIMTIILRFRFHGFVRVFHGDLAVSARPENDFEKVYRMLCDELQKFQDATKRR